MKKKRAGAVLAAMFAAAALPIVVASPAAADQGDCQYALHQAGYVIGPNVQSACAAGAAHQAWSFSQCYGSLLNIGVRPADALAACLEA